MAENNDKWIDESCHRTGRLHRYICGPVLNNKELIKTLRRKNKKLREEIRKLQEKKPCKRQDTIDKKCQRHVTNLHDVI